MRSKSDEPSIAIILLAAGASTRMGTPKQLLKWGSTTLLDHGIDQATKSKAKDVYVILGANQDKITDEIQTRSASILINKDWQLGLGSSISCAIRNINTFNKKYNGLLIMLADQPQVDTNYLDRLIEKFDSEKQQIIATTYANQVGVPAIFDQVYFKELLDLTGDKGAKKIIGEHIARVTTCSPKTKLIDIDTKETYDLLYDEFFNTQ